MDIGVYIHGSSPFFPKETIEDYIQLATLYEEAGVHSLWFADHLIRTPDPNRSGLFESWSLMAGLARETKKLKLGTMVTPITFRTFGTFVNMLATVDHLAQGRIILGLGTGWYAREHKMFGIEMPSQKARFAMLEETLQCLRELWRTPDDKNFTFSGQFLTLEDAYLNPKPVNGEIPILIGGSGPKKTLKLVAQYAQYSNFGGTTEAISYHLSILRGHCDAINRPFSEITPTTNRAIVLGGTEAEVTQGVDQYIQRFKDIGQRAPKPEQFGDTRLVGTPQQVAQQLADLETTGINLVNLTVNDKRTEELLPELLQLL